MAFAWNPCSPRLSCYHDFVTEDRKPWAGRFSGDTSPLVDEFTSSLDVDMRIASEDVRGSIAHARMLGHQGIIPAADAEQILTGLLQIREEINQGIFKLDQSLEDVHMNVEARLGQIIGAAAGRLHTARSRNDQVATDLRLWAKDAIAEVIAGLHELQLALVDLAAMNRRLIIPGYTHLQRAQPILLAHHLLAYFEMLERDVGRFTDTYGRTDVLPLGSGALAGVPYPIDREMVALELDFAEISANSLDAVSDRDFVVEYLGSAAIAGMHISRLAEDIVLWATAEFGIVELPDAFATGSSMMPQKKNPDVMELARGRTGKIYGALTSVLTTLKGLPLTYNRDLQEDKEPFFAAHDTLTASISILAEMLPKLKFNGLRGRRASSGPMLATDYADYLTGKGVAFREAHGIVGRLIAYCEANGRDVSRLSLAELREFSEHFEDDALKIDVWSSVRARDVPGGTAPRQIARAIRRARTILRQREAQS